MVETQGLLEIINTRRNAYLLNVNIFGSNNLFITESFQIIMASIRACMLHLQISI